MKSLSQFRTALGTHTAFLRSARRRYTDVRAHGSVSGIPAQYVASDRAQFSGDESNEQTFRLNADSPNPTVIVRSAVLCDSAGPIGGAIKRLVDIVLAGGALIFFLPLFGLIAGLIKLSDGGPVFYRHRRVGHGWREFGCLKFRTMVTNGDEVLRRHLAGSADAAREWAETRKLKSDPRVTAVGRILRKLSIDELPQLINILRGDMSIVGPRPIVSAEIAMYGPHAELYSRARPGLTGLWQVSGRNDTSYESRVVLDCTYVQNWSHRVDLVIILKTIPVVLSSRGTY